MGTRLRLGIKAVEAIGPDTILWDSVVTGFGARRQTGRAVAYVVAYRTAEGRQRMQTIGRHGSPWTPDTAREEARRILGEVASGADPAAAKREMRAAPTVNALCDLYLAEAEAGRMLTRRGAAKKAATLATDRSRIDAHIRPLLGAMKVVAVTSRDVERAMHDIAAGKTHKRVKLDKPRALSNVRAGKGGASRTVGLLGGVVFGIKRGMRPETRFGAWSASLTGRASGGCRFRNTRRSGRRCGAWAISSPPLTASRRAVTSGRRRWPASLPRPDRLAAGRGAGAALARRGPRYADGAAARHQDRREPAPALPSRLRRAGGAAAGSADGLVFPPSRGVTCMSGLPGFLARW